MSSAEINDADTVAARMPDMDDMRYLTAMRDQMAYPPVTGDGVHRSPSPYEVGYKPRPPADPRWLWLTTIAVLLIAASAVPFILFAG